MIVSRNGRPSDLEYDVPGEGTRIVEPSGERKLAQAAGILA
jgi:hypothetical protein